MAERFTFPQTGDRDDAEHFGSLIGQANLSDYVETGLTLQNYNAAGPDIDVTTGKCFISQASETASTSGDTILQTNSVVQIPSISTLSLTDSAVNNIYVDPDFGTDDNGSVNATTGSVPAGSLKIGEVDTTNDTVTEVNRKPTYDVALITADDATLTDATVDGVATLNGQVDVTSGSIDFEGTGADTTLTLDGGNNLVVETDGNSAIFTFLDSGNAQVNGDLVDGALNTIFDQSNNWVPDSIIQQASLDAQTVKGNDIDSNGDGTVDAADNTSQVNGKNPDRMANRAFFNSGSETQANLTETKFNQSMDNGRLEYVELNSGGAGGSSTVLTLTVTFDDSSTDVYSTTSGNVQESDISVLNNGNRTITNLELVFDDDNGGFSTDWDVQAFGTF